MEFEGYILYDKIYHIFDTVTIYHAYDTYNQREVIIKIIYDKDIYVRENNIMSILSSPICLPHLVCYYGTIPENNAIIMEYIQGYPLWVIIDSWGAQTNIIPYSSDLVWAIIGGSLNGLYEIHTKGIYHGDINLGNIILSDNSLKIIDFGYSNFLTASPDLDPETSSEITKFLTDISFNLDIARDIRGTSRIIDNIIRTGDLSSNQNILFDNNLSKSLFEIVSLFHTATDYYHALHNIKIAQDYGEVVTPEMLNAIPHIDNILLYEHNMLQRYNELNYLQQITSHESYHYI